MFDSSATRQTMSRIFPPAYAQAATQRLRNDLCRLTSPTDMAAVSSHLRNFAVAETIGLIAALDSHPRISRKPEVSKAAAKFQQIKGTTANPFTHVIPSNILLEGNQLRDLFKTARAQEYVERVFGMGVIAPDAGDIQKFAENPRQLNIVDHMTENFHGRSGLVDAFVKTATKAIDAGIWNASGKHTHNSSSLADFINDVYRSTWRPSALAAYSTSLALLSSKWAAAEAIGDPTARVVVQQRIKLLETQLKTCETDTIHVSEVAKNIVTATSEEAWSLQER
jgi:hypothetical protein